MTSRGPTPSLGLGATRHRRDCGELQAGVDRTQTSTCSRRLPTAEDCLDTQEVGSPLYQSGATGLLPVPAECTDKVSMESETGAPGTRPLAPPAFLVLSPGRLLSPF